MIPLDPSPEPEKVMQGTVSSRETANESVAPVVDSGGSAPDHDFTRNPAFVDRSNPSFLTERILLSGCAFAREHERMRGYGIAAVVNLTPDDFGCADAGFEVLHIPIDDAEMFERVHVATFLTQMEQWEERGVTVLIHCHAGISRTSSFAIAWLMHKKGANPQSDLRRMWSQCEDEVGAVRPIIMPHYMLKAVVLQHFERAA